MSYFLLRRPVSLAAAVLIALTASTTFAQNAGEDLPEPVDATVYEPAQAQGLVVGNPNQPQAGALKIPGGTYRSDSLGGDFQAEWMRITIGGNQNGQSFLFWGARAVSLDPDSPLRDLRMRFNNGTFQQFQVGDVLTRLDDIHIDEGKFRDRRGVWQLPELDEHFGPTTVRWIKTRNSHVNVGQIMIDNNATRGGSGGSGGGRVAPVTP